MFHGAALALAEREPAEPEAEHRRQPHAHDAAIIVARLHVIEHQPAHLLEIALGELLALEPQHHDLRMGMLAADVILDVGEAHTAPHAFENEAAGEAFVRMCHKKDEGRMTEGAARGPADGPA